MDNNNEKKIHLNDEEVLQILALMASQKMVEGIGAAIGKDEDVVARSFLEATALARACEILSEKLNPEDTDFEIGL